MQLCRFVKVVLSLGGLDIGSYLLYLPADILDLVDRILLVLPACLHLLELLPHIGKLLLYFRKVLLRETVAFLFQSGFLYFVLHYLSGKLVKLRGHGLHFGLYQGAGFVHKVYSLVGQETVGDISVGKRCRRDKGAVVYLHAVKDLVAFFKSSENGYRVLHRGFSHQHWLETALQSRVLLDVLPVLIQGRSAYAVKLAAGKHGL